MTLQTDWMLLLLPDDVHDLPVCETPVLSQLLDQTEESSEGDTLGGVGHEGDVQLHLDRFYGCIS